MKKIALNHVHLFAPAGFLLMWYRYATSYVSQYLESLKWA